MSDIIRVILRALLSLITLFLVTKLIGKKQVSELSLFDYVIGISIGNFAAEMTINLDSHFTHGTIAVIIFGLIAFLISILTMKSIKLRRFFSGVPTILIYKGQILEKGLKNVKYDINDLLEQARIAGYFDLKDINYAIMESNGSVSFLSKSAKENVKLEDLNLKKDESSICRNIIIDGKYMNNNMNKKEKEMLEKKIKISGKKINEIILATIDNNKNIEIYTKDKSDTESKLE